MKNIVASRTDGFGQRLKVILSAMQIAAQNNFVMRFIWDEKSGEYGKYHSCEPVLEIFSDRFVEKHVIKEKIEGPKFKLNQGHKNSDSQYIILDRFLDLGSPKFHELFEAIDFSEKINKAIAQAQSVSLVNASALHLRGGDILYGPLRKFSIIHQGKIIPLPIAKKMVTSCSKKNWIIFAQDESIQKEFYFKNNVIVSSSLYAGLNSNAEKFIFDVVLMSRCEEIFGGNSGVCDIASMLSGSKIVFTDELFSNHEIVGAIINDPKYMNMEYDKFLLSQLNSTAYFYSKDKTERKYFIDQALSFDPGNNGLLFLRVLACLDLGDFSEANRCVEEKIRLSINSSGRKVLEKYLSDVCAFVSRPAIFSKVFPVELLGSWKKGKYPFLDMFFAFVLYNQGDETFLDELRNDSRVNDFRFFFEIIEK